MSRLVRVLTAADFFVEPSVSHKDPRTGKARETGCVFKSSAGDNACGTRNVGKEAVRAGFAAVWAIFPDAHWENAQHFVHGDRGASEWTFTGTRADGVRVEVHGCDLFTLRDGKIFIKNSYRKNRPPIANSTS